jgi:hypothetical protein
MPDNKRKSAKRSYSAAFTQTFGDQYDMNNCVEVFIPQPMFSVLPVFLNFTARNVPYYGEHWLLEYKITNFPMNPQNLFGETYSSFMNVELSHTINGYIQSGSKLIHKFSWSPKLNVNDGSPDLVSQSTVFSARGSSEHDAAGFFNMRGVLRSFLESNIIKDEIEKTIFEKLGAYHSEYIRNAIRKQAHLPSMGQSFSHQMNNIDVFTQISFRS